MQYVQFVTQLLVYVAYNFGQKLFFTNSLLKDITSNNKSLKDIKATCIDCIKSSICFKIKDLSFFCFNVV